MLAGKASEDMPVSPQQMGSLLYSCVTATSSPEDLLQAALPEVPLQASETPCNDGLSLHAAWLSGSVAAA